MTLGVDIDKLLRKRPKKRIEGLTPNDYGTLEKPRICIDRVYFSVYSDELVGELIGKNFRRDVYEDYYHLRTKMQDDKGYVQGLHFCLCEFEGDEIVWMNLSLREPHIAIVYVNFIRYYRKLRKIPKPSYGYYDTNFLPLDLDDKDKLLDEFCDLYLFVISDLRGIYAELIEKLFGYKINSEEVIVNPFSVELPLEYLGHDIAEYEWLSDVARCKNMVKYSDLTRTMYFNKHSKKITIQMKFYQKAPGIARLELTYHNEFAKRYFNPDVSKDVLKRNILMAIDDALEYYGLSLDQIKPLKLDHDTLLSQFAIAFGLDVDILKTLIYGNVGEITFNKDNQGLRRKLLAKGLIKKGDKRGVYVPSELVRFLKTALGKYVVCKDCGSLMFFDDGKLSFVCPSCGFVKSV